MRKVERYRKSKLDKIIILSTFCLLFVITAGYAAFSTKISLHVKGNILENSRIIQTWGKYSQTDFHSDFYKQNIVNITFLNNNTVPENAVESWNVSEDKEKGTVKAWVVPNLEDTSKYDLYIGAKGKVIANEDSSYAFYGFSVVNKINFDNNYDTSNTTNMNFMFSNCPFLTELNLNSFNTSKVTNMAWIFENNTSLKKIDLSSFDTSNVIYMEGLFNKCSSLESIDLSNFNTSKVVNMQSLFFGCSSLTTIDLSSFDTSEVTNMSYMFAHSNISYLYLNNFNTEKVTNMSGMFNDMKCIEDLYLCSFNTKNVNNFSNMFSLSNRLKNIYVGYGWKVIEGADTAYMFLDSSVSDVTTGLC